MRGGRAFLLGAGFSAKAGYSTLDGLWARAAEIWKAEEYDLFQRLMAWEFADVGGDLPNSVSVVDLCTQIEAMRFFDECNFSQDRLDAISYYIAKAVQNPKGGITVHPCYDEFARGLTTEDLVISLNWDVLLERLLEKYDIPYSYTGESGALHLMKPHGSVHWKRLRVDQQEQGWSRIGGDVCSSRALMEPTNWVGLRSHVPYILLPGYGKLTTIQHFAWVWSLLRKASLSTGFSIIGFSAGPDDFMIAAYLRYVLKDLLGDGQRKVHIINPCDEHADRISGFVRKGVNVERRSWFSDDTVDFALLR